MKRAALAYSKKGIVLALVVSMVLIVSVLIGVALRIVSNQSRFTHHQVSRIQAYYASMAGINYAFEKLRRNEWPQPTSGYNIYTLGSTGGIVETEFPHSVHMVTIAVAYRGTYLTVGGRPMLGCNPCAPPSGVNICICSRADYTPS